MKNRSVTLPLEQVEYWIFTLRGQKVMLDRHLAELYGVKAIALRQQVKRNMERFPNDFMFQANDEEIDYMVSQNVMPSKQHNKIGFVREESTK